MKIIKMAPVGEIADFQEYSVIQLLEQLSSFMLLLKVAGCFPSLSVLNDLFSKGELDEGMSGGASWEKFEISAEERGEILKGISDKYQIVFQPNSKFESIEKYSEWVNLSLELYRPKN